MIENELDDISVMVRGQFPSALVFVSSKRGARLPAELKTVLQGHVVLYQPPEGELIGGIAEQAAQRRILAHALKKIRDLYAQGLLVYLSWQGPKGAWILTDLDVTKSVQR